MAGPEAELKGFRARKWVETPDPELPSGCRRGGK
jgi:hypothetical protein